jgi:DNA modification methylase
MSKKLNKETLDKVRKIDGFPIGSDDVIDNLSDPPYYTACPNPWLTDFVDDYGTNYDPNNDEYQIEAFAADVSADKHDPIYNMISHHTKVPPKAIVRNILHYTKPGDLIYDGFCGSGMTGIASLICAEPDPTFKNIIENENPLVEWGPRHAILCDISPIATYIAYNLNKPLDLEDFKKTSSDISSELDEEYGWMYETQHVVDGKLQYEQDVDGNKKKIMGKINYTVWSSVLICPQCTSELIYYNIAYENQNKLNNLICSHCSANVSMNSLSKFLITVNDNLLDEPTKKVKQVPVLINYSVKENKKKSRFVKSPDDFDLKLLKKINEMKIQDWYPTSSIMMKEGSWGDTWRRGVHKGITHVPDFYMKRTLFVFSGLIKKFSNNFVCFSTLPKLNKKNRFMPEYGAKSLVGPLSGTHYVPPMFVENEVLSHFNFQLRKFLKKINYSTQNSITTQSSTHVPQISDNSIDYIFTDPPFGENIMYSELNFLSESWLQLFTNNENEAIMNSSQGKTILKYQELMKMSFDENYRILKPKRWMTVVFHNSKNFIWIALQQALQQAGFVVADVRILDKKKGTTCQISNPAGAVDQDLVISTYKPFGGLDNYFKQLDVVSESGVWDFIDAHLKQIPVFVEQNNMIETISERQKIRLFDRMTAFHVQKGFHPPLSASEFYEKLHQKYPERDGMYFLAEQISEYDQKRAQVKIMEQTTISVKDEESTILWLNEQLKTPQTYQDIQPKFRKQMHESKFEKLPELSEILEQNFLKDENNKWYVPDPTQHKDLEKLREKTLLREFQTYVGSKSKLKQFRLEAIRAGFKKKWSENNYKSIVEIAQKLPEQIIKEDSNLLMYYHNALSRL